GVIVKTDPFSVERKQNIEDKLQILDENFKSYEIDSAGEIRLKIPPTYDPSKAISTLSDWLMYTGEINTKYAVIQLQLRVEASKLEEIQKYINSRDIVASSVEGPVQDTIENTKEAMPNNNILIFIFGLVGILVALLGVFFDDIIKFIREFIKNIKNK
ncbi:MAG: hypothetical protein LBM26_04420, partial [Methanobrevibacter sp.]|nr:hypothetical protein [Methanobrevibacter sp.]